MGYAIRVQIPDSRRPGTLSPLGEDRVKSIKREKRTLLGRELIRHESIMKAWRKGLLSNDDIRESLQRIDHLRRECEGVKG